MANYANEFSKLYGGSCSVQNKDWNEQRFFDSTADCYASEVALMASLTSEAYNGFGLTCQYYVKNIDLKRDPLFSEDQLENIERRFNLQIYAESIPTLQKQYDLQGMIYTELITCQCSIAHFTEASMIDYLTGQPSYEAIVPRIGDLIYMDYSDLYYEIINVKKFSDGSTFLGMPMTYQFTMRVWRNNHEFVDAYNQNDDKMDHLRSYVQLGETFNMETTETHDETSKVTAESDMLSINEDLKKDVDVNNTPTDNTYSNIMFNPKTSVEQRKNVYDPWAGW